MNQTTNGGLCCIGRFHFAAADFKVTRRSQTIYRVDVNTMPLSAGGFGVAWQARLAEIRALASATLGDPIIRSFELQPGIFGAWYIGDPDSPQLRSLQVLKPADNHFIQADVTADAGNEAMAEGLVREILNAYRPTTEHGFCVGFGSIVLQPAQIERATLKLAHRTLAGVLLRFDTETVKTPDTRTFSNLTEAELVVQGSGGQLSVLRNQQTTAAGLLGRELRIAVTVPGEEPFVRFTWHFPGEPLNAVKPQIDIVGSAYTTQQAALEALWEDMLGSLRPIPPATWWASL